MSNQENISKETKKTRRKRSHRTTQQIKLAVIMIMVSVLVLSASTFAWYKLSNTAKVQSMEFTADTLGDLRICNSKKTDGSSYEEDGDYKTALALMADGSNDEYLMPTTTKEGKVFASPEYDETGENVKSVTELVTDADMKGYVYKKVFFLMVGEKSNNNTGKKFDLKLSKGVIGAGSAPEGTYVIDKDNIDVNGKFIADGTLDVGSESTANDTAANAIRISFVFGTTDTTPQIYEPNSATNNNGNVDNFADTIYNADDSTANVDVAYGKYNTIKQIETGEFAAGTDTTLYEMSEGVPVQVTMYVWIEGTDADCRNSIALDEIAAQIQFEATPQASSSDDSGSNGDGA